MGELREDSPLEDGLRGEGGDGAAGLAEESPEEPRIVAEGVLAAPEAVPPRELISEAGSPEIKGGVGKIVGAARDGIQEEISRVGKERLEGPEGEEWVVGKSSGADDEPAGRGEEEAGQPLGGDSGEVQDDQLPGLGSLVAGRLDVAPPAGEDAKGADLEPGEESRGGVARFVDQVGRKADRNLEELAQALARREVSEPKPKVVAGEDRAESVVGFEALEDGHVELGLGLGVGGRLLLGAGRPRLGEPRLDESRHDVEVAEGAGVLLEVPPGRPEAARPAL